MVLPQTLGALLYLPSLVPDLYIIKEYRRDMKN